MLVVLVLYPVAFLFGRWIGTPFLIKRGVPFWLEFFIGNVVGTLLLSVIVPQVSRAFGWWLNPTGRNPVRINLGGAGLVLLLYGIFLLLFAQLLP